jgi:hypothetical protein
MEKQDIIYTGEEKKIEKGGKENENGMQENKGRERRKENN